MSEIAFHEKAGGCQADFVLPFLSLTFLPSGEILQSRPERSRARRLLGAAQRTLDGEDGSAIVRGGGKVSILSLSSYLVSPLTP